MFKANTIYAMHRIGVECVPLIHSFVSFISAFRMNDEKRNRFSARE